MGKSQGVAWDGFSPSWSGMNYNLQCLTPRNHLYQLNFHSLSRHHQGAVAENQCSERKPTGLFQPKPQHHDYTEAQLDNAGQCSSYEPSFNHTSKARFAT